VGERNKNVRKSTRSLRSGRENKRQKAIGKSNRNKKQSEKSTTKCDALKARIPCVSRVTTNQINAAQYSIGYCE